MLNSAGTRYTAPMSRRQGRLVASAVHGTLFNPHVLEHLACSAVRYHRGVDSIEARVWASAIALFEFNEPAPL